MTIAIRDGEGDVYSADDIFEYCDDGGAFRERLDIQSSGTSGHPIIHKTASGDSPEITAFDVVTSWSSAYIEEESSLDTLNADHTNTAPFWVRTIIPNTVLSTDGDQIRLTVRAHSTEDTTIAGASIMTRSGTSDDGVETPIRITWDTGSSGKVISANGTAVSDWIDVSGLNAGNFDNTLTHLIHVQVDENPDSSIYDRKKNDYLSGAYYKTQATEQTMDQNVTASGLTSNFYSVQVIEVRTPLTESYAKKSVGGNNIDMMVIVDDTTNLTWQGTLASLSVEEFHYDTTSDDLYVRLSDDANVSDHTIEAQIRSHAIYANNKDYITIDGLQLSGGASVIDLWVTDGDGCDYWTIQNNIIEYGTKKGIRVVSSTNNIITKNTIKDIGSPNSAFSPQGIQLDAESDNGANGSNNNTITENLIDTVVDNGFYVWDSDLNIIAQNKILNITNYQSVYVYDSDSNEIYNNIGEGGVSGGGIYLLDGSLTNKIYGNTLLPHDGYYGISLQNNSTGTLIKNNIFYGSVGLKVESGSETNVDIDYNSYYRTSGNLVNWIGTLYTAATWATYLSTSSQDANSPTPPTNPLFTNAAGDDFTLAPGSPCINAGTIPSGFETIYPLDPRLTVLNPWRPVMMANDKGNREIGVYGWPFGDIIEESIIRNIIDYKIVGDIIQ
jgi:parallel beta-helix repeat protein